ncbi:MAG: PQQ-binding-like beta-propeller repeat protein [Lentisphaerales bacterium]|nr:PQQ-binding-like beta-propeller repeat protein [Lentisphaerales bacterium]
MINRIYKVFYLSIFLTLFGAHADTANELLKKADFSGGVILHIGSGNGELSNDLYQSENTLVYGLEKSAEKVQNARAKAYEEGISGKVTYSQWNSEFLPFAQNFINTIICEEEVDDKEIMRVLATYGTALIKSENKWKKLSKEYPSSMDDWPQYFYSPTGNAVSKDKMVKPPLYHLQWTGGPRWSRHHDVMSSFSACVSAGGRLFYVFDEGTTFSPMLPPKWKLICRDAFNGTILWKVDIPKWFPTMHALKSGPSHLPRRIVATADKLYATLSIEGAVSVLDTKTGKVLDVIEGSQGAEEIVMEKDVLYIVCDKEKNKKELSRYPYSIKKLEKRPKDIIKVDRHSLKTLWHHKSSWNAPLSFCADARNVYYFDGASIVALDKNSAEQQWRSESLPVMKDMESFFGPTVVAEKNRVLYTGGENYKGHIGSQGKMIVLDAFAGKKLWEAASPPSGYKSSENLFVIRGMIWQNDNTAEYGKGKPSTGITTATGFERGEEVLSFEPDKEAYFFHHRCYPAKATEDYLLLSRTGIEFVDLKTKEWTLHQWVRGACLYGIMPANGMVYSPQSPCACYIGAKLDGFPALTAKNSEHPVWQKTADEKRLIAGETKGRAFEDVEDKKNWPIYRHNNRRSGTSSNTVEAISKEEWRLDLGGKLTQPVLAEGKLLIVQKGQYTVHALDAKSGKKLWHFTAGGQVDSSPTVYKHRCYFGSADGFIYCLDLADGKLIWKYQGAPSKSKHMYYEKLESTHPLHGSVLIHEDKIYALAGRSMFVDGGMNFLILDAKTGKKIKEVVMDDKVPGTDKELQMQHEVLSMPQALNDLLTCDGKEIHMRKQDFDLEGNRLELKNGEPFYARFSGKAKPNEVYRKKKGNPHIISGTGFLDDSWWHRTYWTFGDNYISGHMGYYVSGKEYPSGRIMSFGDDGVIAWGRMTQYYRWSKEYEYYLFNRSYENKENWGVRVPILVRSMTRAKNKLFIFGPEELLNQKKSMNILDQASTQETAQKQDDAYHGKSGALLLSVDPKNGQMTEGYKLHTTPVFDGMVNAYNKLYISMSDGSVICLGGEGQANQALSGEDIASYNAIAKVEPYVPSKKKPKKKKK